MSADNTQDTIGQIYQATLEPELWLSVLEQLHRQLDSAKEHSLNEQDSSVDRVALLSEHCRRAKEITQELHSHQEQSVTWKHLVDHLPMAVFFVDHNLRAIANNCRGDTLLSEGQYVSINHQQQLCLKTPLLSKQLAKMVAVAGSSPAQGMPLDSDANVLLMAIPIQKIEIDVPLMGASTALLVFTADERITPDLQVIRSLHQLTHAEAKLTHGLCLTHSLAEAAQLSGISLNTARSYLKSIYSKTSSNSQLELVRKVVGASFASMGFACGVKTNDNHYLSLRLPDKRLLTWYEYGDPSGQPVVVFENVGGSLPQHQQYVDDYREQNQRVIVIVRPGYGGSSYNQDNTFVSVADDVIHLLDYCNIRKANVIGYSMGGAYAAVLAACYPERVKHLGLLSTALPWQFVQSQNLATHQRLLSSLLNVSPEAFRFVMSLMMRSTYRDPASFYRKLATQVYHRDAALLNDSIWQQQLGEQLKRRLMGGVKVYVQEYLMLRKGWGKRISDIQCPVLIWHGDEDRLVDHKGVSEFAAQFADAALDIHSGYGHFMVCEKWGDFFTACSRRNKDVQEKVLLQYT